MLKLPPNGKVSWCIARGYFHTEERAKRFSTGEKKILKQINYSLQGKANDLAAGLGCYQ